MRDEIANLVHPVLSYGLELKQRLDADSPDLVQEQAALKALLLSDHEARRWAEYGGENAPESSMLGGAVRATQSERRPVEHFLGIRYALVCWLDEIFIDSRWRNEWNERKLEDLYGTNDRAWKFWDQARRAEGRAGTDSLEVFFLCVMLGFRGELRDQPERLRKWTDAALERVRRRQAQAWPAPPELQAPTNVPPRRGRAAFERMLVIWAAVVLLLAPVVAFAVVRFFSQG